MKEYMKAIVIVFAVLASASLVGYFILICVDRNTAYNIKMQEQGYEWRERGWYRVDKGAHP